MKRFSRKQTQIFGIRTLTDLVHQMHTFGWRLSIIEYVDYSAEQVRMFFKVNKSLKNSYTIWIWGNSLISVTAQYRVNPPSMLLHRPLQTITKNYAAISRIQGFYTLPRVPDLAYNASAQFPCLILPVPFLAYASAALKITLQNLVVQGPN